MPPKTPTTVPGAPAAGHHRAVGRMWPSYLALAAVLLAALFAWQRGAGVNYAEGVYLSSARLITGGAVPYADFLAAHPPLLFYAGAAILGVWDSIDAVRLSLSALALGRGALVALAVLRLTASAPAAIVAGLLALLAPWSLHEHAILTPETFAAPLLLAAAVLAARRGTAIPAGLVAAVAVGFKWPYLLPGLALAVATPARWRYLAALTAGFAAGVLLSFALFGADPLYRQLVVAQQDVGWHSLRQFAGLAAQAAWSLVPLLVAAAFALRLAHRAADPALLRTLLALAAANLLLVGTVAKTGTYLNTIVAVEPALVALGVAGTVWLVREGARRRSRAAVAVVAGAWALFALQVASFLVRPTDPGLFVRPLSAPAHAWLAEERVAAAVDAARACPPGVPYSGEPFIAFLAGRGMPGDEPDPFLLTMTPVGARAAQRAGADTPTCPP